MDNDELTLSTHALTFAKDVWVFMALDLVLIN